MESSTQNKLEQTGTNRTNREKDETAERNESCDEAAKQVLPATPPQGCHPKAAKPKGRDLSKTLNIAVSSRALFDLKEEHDTFDKKGLGEYVKMQVEKENDVLLPGSAFPFIKALKNVNDALITRDPQEEELFTVTLMSKNSAEVGIRLQKSINHYKELKIPRMALTSGTSPVNYLKAFNIILFLTSDEKDVEEALRLGFPSAVMSTQEINPQTETQLRVAFDLDAVLFSDESEKIFGQHGLKAFQEHEKKNVDKPLEDGPIKPFAMALGKMRKKFSYSEDNICPIRTFLITSRDTEFGGERAMKTLRSWGLQIDESFFMAGTTKKEILKAINPHIFFDDQISHIDGARMTGTPSGLVPNIS